MNFAEQIYNANDEESFEQAKRELVDTFNASPAQKMLGIEFKISTDWQWVQDHKDMNFGNLRVLFLKDFFLKGLGC